MDNIDPTDIAIKIIDLIGCVPVIAETQPKLSRPVHSLVHDTLDTCDGAIVIATADRDGNNGKEPSQSVLVEIGNLQKIEKFKGKYFIIKEDSVVLGPMIPEARYKFNNSNYTPIAEAILCELNSMGFFRNFYEIEGSNLQIQELMDVFFKIRDLYKRGYLKPDVLKPIVDTVVNKIIEGICKDI